MKNRISNENGSIILIALALLGILTMVGLVAVDNSTTDMEMSYNQMNEEQAFYVAEAGAVSAKKVLDEDRNWRDGYSGVAFGYGTYSVKIVDSSSDPALADTMLIQSTGNLNSAEATVTLDVTPTKIKIFNYAMFADKGIVMDRDACTDSFNSDSGSYAATSLDSLGNIGSNTSVFVGKNNYVGGDIDVATPGGLDATSPGIKITGDTTSTADSMSLDIIPQSEYDWAKSVSIASTGITGTGFTYNNGSKQLTLGASANIVLSSGVYYFSDIVMGQDCTVSLAPGADVVIYMSGNIDFNQNSYVNAGGDPSALQIYSQGDTFQLDQGNKFYGTFYGPNAHIQYDQTSEVFGALVGGDIKLDAGACFHYDRNLSEIERNAKKGVTIVAWGELY